MTEPAADRFWAFSLDVYGKPGVAPGLIDLQDRLGLDVNLLLFCCWAGREGRRLSLTDLKAIEAATHLWQAEVVRPLRALRRRLKSGFADLPADAVSALRKRIGDAEIEGERIAQVSMAPLLPAAEARDADSAAALVAANLKTCFRYADRSIGIAEEAVLRTILQACCGGEGLERISFASA